MFSKDSFCYELVSASRLTTPNLLLIGLLIIRISTFLHWKITRVLLADEANIEKLVCDYQVLVGAFFKFGVGIEFYLL